MSRTTIRDIANALGINPSTVSRALKDHPDIGKPLKEKIQAVASDLGYMPNQYASNLRSGKTFTIGLIVPEMCYFFFPSVIQAAEEMTHQYGYRLLTLHSNDRLETEAENARILARYGVDGVLASLSRETQNLNHFRCLTDNEIPLLFYDKIASQPNTHNISFQNDAAVNNAVEYLMSNGKKPDRFVGFFGDEKLSISYSGERLAAFKNAMNMHGYGVGDYDIVFADSVGEAAMKSKELFARQDRPDACVAMGDDRLLGVSKSILQLGIRVPDEMAIISLSDGFIPGTLAFEMPYVLTSGYRMGKAATQLLFDLIEHKEIAPGISWLETPVMHTLYSGINAAPNVVFEQ
ncbi:MAG: LacI family DNA-binding transcriptional regulator [Chitinophagaceae bacterium]